MHPLKNTVIQSKFGLISKLRFQLLIKNPNLQLNKLPNLHKHNLLNFKTF